MPGTRAPCRPACPGAPPRADSRSPYGQAATRSRSRIAMSARPRRSSASAAPTAAAGSSQGAGAPRRPAPPPPQQRQRRADGRRRIVPGGGRLLVALHVVDLELLARDGGRAPVLVEPRPDLGLEVAPGRPRGGPQADRVHPAL